MSAIAAMHVARKQLGLDEDTYRAVLVRVTGKNSARDMSEAERNRVVEAFRKQGFKTGVSKGLQGPFAKKLQALWIGAWNLGLVRDRRDAAMLTFVKRQTGIDHTRFLLDAEDAAKAIEALKAWMRREAGVMWGNSNGHDFLTHEPGKIAWAQFQKVIPGATLMGNSGCFHHEVAKILGRIPNGGLGELKPADWRVIMNTLGERIRKAVR